MEVSCKSCLAKLFLKLLHGAVLQKLPYKAISQAFAWNCHAEVAFAKLFLKLLCESVVQKLPFETISLAFVWNCRAKVALCEILFSISRLLNKRRSLGRRLSYLGRNQIRLFMVHDTA